MSQDRLSNSQVICTDPHLLFLSATSTSLGSFSGWTEDELPERSPIVAAFVDDRPVSICFCARVSETAAEAGVETTPDFRGRGLAGMVTVGWAAEVRASGRTPIYSTSWNNKPSLAVASKLGLVVCASYWSINARDEGRHSLGVLTSAGSATTLLYAVSGQQIKCR